MTLLFVQWVYRFLRLVAPTLEGISGVKLGIRLEMAYFSQSVWTRLVCRIQRETLVTSATRKKLEDLCLELEMLKEPHEMLFV